MEKLTIEIQCRVRQIMEDEFMKCYKGPICGEMCRPAFNAAYREAKITVQSEFVLGIYRARDKAVMGFADMLLARRADDSSNMP